MCKQKMEGKGLSVSPFLISKGIQIGSQAFGRQNERCGISLFLGSAYGQTAPCCIGLAGDGHPSPSDTQTGFTNSSFCCFPCGANRNFGSGAIFVGAAAQGEIASYGPNLGTPSSI